MPRDWGAVSGQGVVTESGAGRHGQMCRTEHRGLWAGCLHGRLCRKGLDLLRGGGGAFPECTTFSVSGKEPQEEGTGGPDAPAM